jgi:hypothetical protein
MVVIGAAMQTRLPLASSVRNAGHPIHEEQAIAC